MSHAETVSRKSGRPQGPSDPPLSPYCLRAPDEAWAIAMAYLLPERRGKRPGYIRKPSKIALRNRRRLIYTLARLNQGVAIARLADIADVHVSKASQHVNAMAAEGVVRIDRIGVRAFVVLARVP